MKTVRNNYIIEEAVPRNICSASINIIMFIRLILGMYSEISDNYIFTVIAKLYCICFAVFGTYIIVYISRAFLPDSVAFGLIQKLVFYNIIVLASLLSNGENIYKYIRGLWTIDAISSLKYVKYEPLIASCMFLIIFFGSIYRAIFGIIMHGTQRNAVWSIVSVICFIMGICTNHMTRIIMFEMLWNRMKLLRKQIETHLVFSENTADREVKQNILDLEKYLKVYNLLLDNLINVGHASKLLIFLSLTFYFLYVVMFVLDTILHNEVYELSVFYISDVMTNTILPLVPALFAELTTAEVEKINRHLTRQLLYGSNIALRHRICDAIKFLELRPFKYTIWRAFRLDISLPLGLISLCTTYTIVVIQFSHVYT